MADCEAQQVADSSLDTLATDPRTIDKLNELVPNEATTGFLGRLARLAKTWGGLVGVSSVALIAGASVGILTASQLFPSSSPFTSQPVPSASHSVTPTVIPPTQSIPSLNTTQPNTLPPPLSVLNSSSTESYEEFYRLPGFQAVCGDGVCSFSERCSSCVQDCGVCSPGVIMAHYVVGSNTNSTRYMEEMILAQQYGINAFALQVKLWPGSSPNYEAACDALFDAADKVNFKLFFTVRLLEETDTWNTAILSNMLSKYAARSSYLYLNGKQVLSTMGGIVRTTRPWDWYTWLYAQSTAGRPIYFMPGFDSDAPSNELKWHYFYVDGYLNLNTWVTVNQTLQALHEREAIMNNYMNGDYIPSVAAWYAQGSNVKGNHGFLAVKRWQHILSLASSIRHVYLSSWNDYSDATYLIRDTQPTSHYTYHHLYMLDLQSVFIKAFQEGNALSYEETIYYYYRLYQQPTWFNDTTSYSQPTVLEDFLYIVCFLNEPGTLQINSGDTVVQTNMTAGLQLFSTPFQVGVQTVTLTRGTINVLSSTGKYTIQNETKMDEFSYNYYINKMRESL